MKRVSALLGAALLMAPPVFAAEASTERGVSIFDARPHCMERDVHPDDPLCTLQDGPPGRRYPLAVLPLPIPPGTPGVPPGISPVPREPARAGPRASG